MKDLERIPHNNTKMYEAERIPHNNTKMYEAVKNINRMKPQRKRSLLRTREQAKIVAEHF